MRKLIRIIRWLSLCARYAISAAWPVWLISAIFLICYLSIKFFSPAEPTIRLTGMGLQIAGFVMATWQLLETRRALNLPNMWTGLRNYFAGFPKFKNTAHLAASLGGITAQMSASAVVIRNPKAKLKDRVDRLERDVDALRTKIGEVDAKVGAEATALRKLLLEKSESLQSDLTKLESRFSHLVGGGTTLELVGVSYFVAGLVLASSSPEIAAAIPAN